MIVLQNSSGSMNIVHLIMGPQTQFQFDMAGSIEVDLQKLLDGFDKKTNPVKLIITRSLNESETSMILSSMQGRSIISGDEPEHSPKEGMTKLLKMMHDEMIKQNKKKTTVELKNVDDPRGQWEPKLICPKCLKKGVFLKEGCMPLCGDCVKIEKGIGNLKKVGKSQKATTTTENPEESKSE